MRLLNNLLLGCVVCCAGPSLAETSVFTLYRGSLVPDSRGVHVATFDAEQSGNYNFDNCQIAAELFQGQTGVTVRYWCEQGRAYTTKGPRS